MPNLKPDGTVTYGKEYPRLTDEECALIQEKFPHIEMNLEDQTFVSKKGNTAPMRMLLKFTPWNENLAKARIVAAEKKTEYSEKKYEKYLKGLEQGMRISEAARAANLNLHTLYTKRRRDPEFRQREQEAETIAAEPVENSLWDAAINGNVPAAVKWLEKRAPERWPSEKMVVETKTTLEIEAGDRITQIAALMARLEERRAVGAAPYIDVEALEPGEE